MWYWFIMTVHLWSLAGKRNAQEGTKAQRYAATHLWCCCHTFLRLWQYAQYQTWHSCSTDLAWCRLHLLVRRWQAMLVLHQLAFIKASWASTAWLSSAWCWLTLVLFTLPLLIVSRHTGTVLAVSSGSYCKRCMWQLNIICFIVHVNLYLRVTCSYHLYM